jgi:malonyl-CoA decarboxylase
MVNYLYDLSQITANHEQFVGEKTVIASSEVRALSATVDTEA